MQNYESMLFPAVVASIVIFHVLCLCAAFSQVTCYGEEACTSHKGGG